MVSKTYFCYLFKLLTHQTFIEYLVNRRINKAMELLRQTDMSVIDIGQAVGFRDSTHFSRTCRGRAVLS
ncbi:helix-turn-helix transcriptional regulator [Ruthenibacterium lactatiformans]|uniref:helix-turn-helix transcriptional regulator n=1 Tax=Ruthenibacterium lactatiformans TaxID=1550024 RepID=UPI003979D532